MGMNALIFNVLKEIGINPARFSLQWASAAEAPRFVKLITEFTGKVRELGPLGESEGIAPEELKEKLAKGLAAVSSRKLRMVYGNTAKSIRKEGIFTQEYINAVIGEKLGKSIVGALSAEPEVEEEKGAPAVKSAKEKPAPAPTGAPGKTAATSGGIPAQKAAKKQAAKPAPKKGAAKVAKSAKKTGPKKAAKPAAGKKTASKKKK